MNIFLSNISAKRVSTIFYITKEFPLKFGKRNDDLDFCFDSKIF